jgi:hypothetical protein
MDVTGHVSNRELLAFVFWGAACLFVIWRVSLRIED